MALVCVNVQLHGISFKKWDNNIDLEWPGKRYSCVPLRYVWDYYESSMVVSVNLSYLTRECNGTVGYHLLSIKHMTRDWYLSLQCLLLTAISEQ